ncbi:EAL domain-containing protein [Alteraurantiacibacter aquimixticola]|uniref:EAL domain-containing protein n=1 Tax=Alteraurantiacibacter aquimixticola TaxID=2489173 RepID=A0A4T3EZR6_9SPHN|nr:EAL domain-containing protein [Alteraurantiacibacter aquimixticola]TIX50272.1 EAL domain-containing protein [Alteraurantiacibacter aquimixticola]
MAVRDILRGKRTKAPPTSRAPQDEGATDVRNPSSDEGEGPGALGASERMAMFDAFEKYDLGWFWATDALGAITYLSESAAGCLGIEGPVAGQLLTALMETADESGEVGGERPLQFFIASRMRFTDLVVRLRHDRPEQWWSITGSPHYDEEGRFRGFRGSAKDISELFLRQRDETRLAQFDTLTGLANRHRMEQRLTAILASYRVAKRTCALLMMDLDRFKQVNDTLGHPAGDELLRQVSQRLQSIISAPAEVGRLGGDEFQIIIPDMADRGHLGERARKIIQMLSQPYALGNDRASIGCSVGIAIAPYDGATPEELVKAADMALYAAKGSGRGRFRFFANDLADAAQRQRKIGEDLSEALKADQLVMHYQPIVRTSDNTVTAFEALLRWDHPDRGPIPPGTFVPLAEQINLIDELGEWSLERACRDALAWPGGIRVAVNISAQQFFSGSLPDLVEKVLDRTGLPPARLELEITEGVFMGETQLVDRTFEALAKIGVRLALDDFGTGLSSLSFLRRAPFRKIKIDQSFVRRCAEPGNSNAAIITAIVSLAGALQLETTAEGVEAMDELQLVKAQGVTEIQGFILSRAVTQAVLMQRLSSGDFTYEPAGPRRPRNERRSTLRRVGVIHEDHRYVAVLRNLSRTGALIEGLLDVPVGTDLVLDLGGGQLAVARVRRSQDATQGVEFETPLVNDGADGLCTRTRVSPQLMAAADLPLGPGLGEGPQPLRKGVSGKPRFMQVDVFAGSHRAA